MTTKSILNDLNKQIGTNSLECLRNLQLNNKDGANLYYATVELLEDKFKNVLGSKASQYDALITTLATNAACNDAQIKYYMNIHDLNNLYRCIGTLETLGYQAIDQVFPS